MNHVYIIGYYGHSNLGDEQYKITFDYIFSYYYQHSEITWMDCDQIESYTFNDTDIIILGGGDVLNPYFLDPIYQMFKNRPNRLFAVSVGIPYLGILTHPGIRRFDAIFLRTRQDLDRLSEYYNPTRIHYLPDVSGIIFRLYRPIPRFQQICISLARTVYHYQHPREYHQLVESLGLLINQLVAKNYVIYLIPFNTSESPDENDVLIQTDVHRTILNPSQVININTSLNLVDTMTILQSSQFCIAMRYHAVLLSMYTRTPVIPLYTTRKIKNLILDTQWPFDIPLRVNASDIPRGLTLNQINQIQSYLTSDVNSLKFSDPQPDLYHGLVCLLDYMTRPTLDRLNDSVKDSEQVFTDLQQVFQIRQLNEVSDPILQQEIVKFVSFRLTRQFYSKYNYGLLTKMFASGYDFYSEWDWVRQDQAIHGNVLPSHSDGVFNMDYICQENPNSLHRSGWNYVYEYLKPFHNKQAPILLDLYVDRTFHWDYSSLKHLGIVPYTKPWIGFIHHPFDTTFSQYNSTELFKNPDFIQSLQCCKGIFVLSRYLKEEFIRECISYKVYPKIYVLTHPTETAVQSFSYAKWVDQTDKRLLHIGGWLRRTFNFYGLEIPNDLVAVSKYCCGSSVNYSLKKTVLRGLQMNNYFPVEGFSEKFTQFLKDLEYSSSQQIISSGGVRNNWNMQCLNHVKNMINSVDEISHVSNELYDDLLSKHIVMIDLVDASAVNTLIECVVRNTPILINAHPAVIEVLGKDYPLYFKCNSTISELSTEVQKLLSNKRIIYKAHQYLRKLDKSRFTIRYFIKEFLEIIQTM